MKVKDSLNGLLPNKANAESKIVEFLPAALEIQHTPPNPLPKWLARSLMVLVVIAVAWSIWGEVNIVASAEGKIIPSARVKTIQPLQKAMVKTIYVSEGQSVEKGEPLIELDSTLTTADENRVKSELTSIQLRLGVNEAFLKLLDTNDKQAFANSPLPSDNLESLDVEDKAFYRDMLQQQWEEYSAREKTLRTALRKNKAEYGASQQIVKKLTKTLPIIEKRTKAMKALYDQKYVSETEYLVLEQERIQQSQDLAAERYRLEQLMAAKEEIQQQQRVLVAQTKSERLSESAELKRQIKSLSEELAKATDINNKQILYAPVAGQVQTLAINTVGGVVTDAQELMQIVPYDEELEAEVFLENKDIGFVREGMKAEIKVHTFPFTKYGIIDAEIINVSDDAIVDENKGLVYKMQLRLSRNYMTLNEEKIQLMPGMAISAEVQTGNRKIIEFFLAPLLKHKQESLRER